MGKSRFSRFKNAPKPAKTAQVTLHTEPAHIDSDLITASSFPFSELIPTWSTFNPNTKNAATGSTFCSGHHGSSGGKKLSDFKSFRLACCLEPVDKKVDGVWRRVRCMNVFTVDSNQCTTHRKTTHKDGPNRIYTLMKRNEVGDWGMLRDTDAVVRPCRSPDWQLQAAARLDEVAANGEDADVVWASDKLESELAHGKIAGNRGVGVRTVVDDKGKSGVGGKLAVKHCWKGTRLRPISEK
ncbi:uncharacterized protein EKO05_0003615 [Ascochyta rabiei]|uniref:Uncharacterized protein n=1 Tax=Didymella rabiei TaxID=5454 RepID=A0A163M1V5_DIDRA|nr:uncharacterized protein EKO05_0003615 [Ascochyta rabiei]KZM28323.1 hypothetical protein ST47_g530 [Ascochyta rabiei]UPX13087.1 hypothetical protein EKO05_0003615 [Ascochyta rabiei]